MVLPTIFYGNYIANPKISYIQVSEIMTIYQGTFNTKLEIYTKVNLISNLVKFNFVPIAVTTL